jgi:hypothetical protein
MVAALCVIFLVVGGQIGYFLLSHVAPRSTDDQGDAGEGKVVQ